MPIQNTTFNHSNLCPEINFLLYCARPELNEKQITQAKTILEKKINWDLFSKLTLNHGMAPLVYQHINKHFNEYVPDSNKAVLRNFVLASTQSNLGLLRELFNIIKTLNDNNIKCIPFKGLIVAQRIYQDFSARKCGDIDILVKQDDFYKAKNIFLSQGFQQTLNKKIEFDYLQSGLHHEQRRISLDLHYGLPPKAVDICASKLFNDVTNITIGQKQVSTLSDIDMFLVLCINATKEYWNQKLYTYCDIHAFLQNNKNIDWSLIVKRANKLRCKRMLFTALLVCHELYGIPDTQRIVNELNSLSKIKPTKNELLIQLLPADAQNFSSMRGKLYCLESEKEFFTRFMDTSAVRLKHELPKFLKLNERDLSVLRLPQHFYFLYYFIKPFRVLFKRSREFFYKIFS